MLNNNTNMEFKKKANLRVADHRTVMHLQELIYECLPLTVASKAVIGEQEILFYKFGLKMGRLRLEPNYIFYMNGELVYVGLSDPCVVDKTIYYQLLSLFDLQP